MSFEHDQYPNAPKILFIGWPNSSHTHSWVDLLEGERFNVRLFGLPTLPPDDWPVRTYLCGHHPNPNPANRKPLFNTVQRLRRGLSRHLPRIGAGAAEEDALAKVLTTWRPDIIHTLGFDPGSYLLLRTWDKHPRSRGGKWVAQARGGPDLYLYRFNPDLKRSIQRVFNECDYFVADNHWNYDYARSQGLPDSKLTPLGVISGTGGMDVDGLRARWTTPPSRRERVIYMPKTYENQAVKGLSALEALRIAWPRIAPCKVVMAWVVQQDMSMWIPARLGEDIMRHCEVNPLLPREESLRHMISARVVFSPSVLDGVPNSMLEAMCCGAMPIVSPLESIEGVVRQEENVLFADNLYPTDMAEALVHAMNDDALVDAAALRNVERVRELSDRKRNKVALRDFYTAIAAG